MRHILLLQLVYLVLAVGFNIVSLSRIRAGKMPLTPSSMKVVAIVYPLYVAILLLGWLMFGVVYATLVAAFGAFIFNVGVMSHVKRGFSDDKYQSFFTYVVAISINIYGTMVNVAPLIMGFRS